MSVLARVSGTSDTHCTQEWAFEVDYCSAIIRSHKLACIDHYYKTTLFSYYLAGFFQNLDYFLCGGHTRLEGKPETKTSCEEARTDNHGLQPLGSNHGCVGGSQPNFDCIDSAAYAYWGILANW